MLPQLPVLSRRRRRAARTCFVSVRLRVAPAPESAGKSSRPVSKQRLAVANLFGFGGVVRAQLCLISKEEIRLVLSAGFGNVEIDEAIECFETLSAATRAILVDLFGNSVG